MQQAQQLDSQISKAVYWRVTMGPKPAALSTPTPPMPPPLKETAVLPSPEALPLDVLPALEALARQAAICLEDAVVWFAYEHVWWQLAVTDGATLLWSSCETPPDELGCPARMDEAIDGGSSLCGIVGRARSQRLLRGERRLLEELCTGAHRCLSAKARAATAMAAPPPTPPSELAPSPQLARKNEPLVSRLIGQLLHLRRSARDAAARQLAALGIDLAGYTPDLPPARRRERQRDCLELWVARRWWVDCEL